MKFLNSIHEREFVLFGSKLTLRFEPKEFRDLMKRVNSLVSAREFDEAKKLVVSGYLRWNSDPELIRADTLIAFLSEE